MPQRPSWYIVISGAPVARLERASDFEGRGYEEGLTARLLALLAVVLTATGCLGPVATLYPPRADERTKSLWVLGHGWHTAIVVRRADISSSIWPEHNDFPHAQFLEVAWGDRDFYQAERGTVWLALKAAFVSPESVLHVVGFSAPIEQYFPSSDVVEVTTSARGFDELSWFIHESYARNGDGQTVRLGQGQYGTSSFYLATGNYHLLNTCNNWIAKALRAAGLPITPLYSMTTGNVLRQVSRFGRVLRESSL